MAQLTFVRHYLVYLGTVVLVKGWNKIIHRTERCDLSLFNLGLSLLEHLLNEMMPLPDAFIPLDHPDEGEGYKGVR